MNPDPRIFKMLVDEGKRVVEDKTSKLTCYLLCLGEALSPRLREENGRLHGNYVGVVSGKQPEFSGAKRVTAWAI